MTSKQIIADPMIVFKDAWHKADLEPGAQEKYIEVMDMMKKMSDHKGKLSRKLVEFQLLVWLNEHPRAHRHVLRDIERANIMIGLFYPTDFYESEAGLEFKNSFLLQQNEQSKCIPNRRTHSSAEYLPESIWKEWDKAQLEPNFIDSQFLIKSDIATRPIIARCKFLNVYLQDPNLCNLVPVPDMKRNPLIHSLCHYSIQRRHHLQRLHIRRERPGNRHQRVQPLTRPLH